MDKKFNFQEQSGFSLVEMLISMSLLVIVVAAFYAIAVQTFGIWKKSDVRSEVQQTAQIAIEEMVREARQATQNDNYPVIVGFDASSSTNRASMRFFMSNSTTDFTYVRYRFSAEAKQIIRDTLAAGVKPTKLNWTSGNLTWTVPEVLADNVDNFSFVPANKTFTGTAADSRNLLLDVRVSAASRSYTNTGNEVMNLRTRINLRNF